jgi:hypothetical protein
LRHGASNAGLSQKSKLLRVLPAVQTIMDAFELQQEERKICQHIKKSFDKEWSKFSYKKA